MLDSLKDFSLKWLIPEDTQKDRYMKFLKAILTAVPQLHYYQDYLKVFNLVSFQKKNERVEPIGDGLNVGFVERLQP